ncbi:dihydrofolate reductase [Treponema bryantii]|uniref:dihydrofolate reductase n=1 Tax=Treponema bryantii TaxID=163 RepID=UPI0003B4E0E5|nr:dihydrofolate reductase [Treponema bryantii]
MISLIVAYAKNRVIGNKGRIPWSLPSDQQRFKEITKGGLVIMGRRTFEEIYKKFGHGLPGRETLVISKSQNFEGEGFRTVKDFQAALDYAGNHFPQKDIFICGGQSIYQEAISSGIVEKFYLTEIDSEFEGDTYFPEFEKKDLKIIKNQKFNDVYPYTFIIYSR